MSKLVEIEVLPFAEAIRRNAAMYVGPVDGTNVLNLLIQEALCLSLDEVAIGKCSRISVTIGDDRCVTVRDNGPGIDMTIDQFGESFAENLFTRLYACRDSKRGAHLKGRCCGVGIAAVNALCDRFRVRNYRDGVCWAQEYRRAEAKGPFQKVCATDASGVEVCFEPDQTILTKLQFNRRKMIRWIKSTEVGLTVVRSRRRPGAAEAILEFALI